MKKQTPWGWPDGAPTTYRPIVLEEIVFRYSLQLQERLTHQIADEVQRITESHDVVVVGRGEHLCMSMRGIRTTALMTSSVVRGRFRELDALRAETLALMTGRTP